MEASPNAAGKAANAAQNGASDEGEIDEGRCSHPGAVVEPDAGDLDALTDRFRSELKARMQEHVADDDSKD
eukprot:1249244-Amphidinium_carterae.1